MRAWLGGLFVLVTSGSPKAVSKTCLFLLPQFRDVLFTETSNHVCSSYTEDLLGLCSTLYNLGHARQLGPRNEPYANHPCTLCLLRTGNRSRSQSASWISLINQQPLAVWNIDGTGNKGLKCFFEFPTLLLLAANKRA